MLIFLTRKTKDGELVGVLVNTEAIFYVDDGPGVSTITSTSGGKLEVAEDLEQIWDKSTR